MSCKILTTDKGLACLMLLLCLFLLPSSKVHAIPQQSSTYKVSGVVKDTSGESIIGASVLEKGTTNGIITDIDGKFTLSVNPNATLTISFIGN